MGMRNLLTSSRWIRAELRFGLHGQMTPSDGESLSPPNLLGVYEWSVIWTFWLIMAQISPPRAIGREVLVGAAGSTAEP